MLTAWSAVALCRAVERACGVHPGIKWPNDLVMQGRKLCGVLTELELEAETGLPRYVIVGIGTNVLQTEADFGPEVAPIAISLEQALGQAPARTALAKEILRAMDDLYRDFPQEKAQYLEQYRRDCPDAGQTRYRAAVLRRTERLCHRDQRGFFPDGSLGGRHGRSAFRRRGFRPGTVRLCLSHSLCICLVFPGRALYNMG